MNALFILYAIMSLIGLSVVAISESSSMTMLRWIIIDWSFDQVEKISQGCCKNVILFSLLHVLEFILKWVLMIVTALILGILPWLWLPFWHFILMKYWAAKYQWLLCEYYKNKDNN